MKTYTKYLGLIFLFILTACSDDAPSADSERERPHTPFVFRSVLDQNPRMVTLALDEAMWASYHINSCALYKAWQGEVNFQGTVYDTHHGPQPTTIGNAYQENSIASPWKIIDPSGKVMDAKADYKGHKIVKGQGVLMYEISTEGVSPTLVEETVEYSDSESMQPIFQRSFMTVGTPDGYQVALDFNTTGIVVKSNIDTDGELKVITEEPIKDGKIEYLNLEGRLVLNYNATTRFNTTFLAKPTLINPLNMGLEEEEDAANGLHPGARLIAQSDCKTCHNKKVKTIGPAYVSVARKYKTTEENIAYLSSKVRNGGTGVWGNQIMNAHPDLSDEDIKEMVMYVLSLDAEEEGISTNEKAASTVSVTPVQGVNYDDLIPGAPTAIYNWKNLGDKIPNVPAGRKPDYSGVMPNFDNLNGDDWKNLVDDFVLISKAYLNVEKSQKYKFRTWSDDGSKFFIDGQEVINNDGMHGTQFKENEVYLEKGLYPFELQFMQGSGGKYLSLNWRGADDEQWMVIPRDNILHNPSQRMLDGGPLEMAVSNGVPGDRSPLEEVHPSFTLTQARSDDFKPKVGGIDFMSDGRMIVSTWDPAGSVYAIENHNSPDPSKIKHKLIAKGLAEPLGVKVVNDRIFVMQKQEITELIDVNGDDVTDEYRTLCDDWQVSANFHEFGFGLEEKDGYLYASLATAIEPGGASSNPQITDRGKVLKVNIETGEREFVAHGLRTPNGIGLGYGGDIYVADNQGDWLPASKIVHIQEGAWYGSRSVDFDGTANLKETPPVVWLPQDEIGNSPSTPLAINVGPYKGQMIHGEVTHGGIKRVFVEEIEGIRQGALFRFIQGLEAGVNRIRWSPDGALYVGCIGAPGNWGQTGKLWHGLQRLEYNDKSTFEMLAVRAKSNGFEIEFTEPLSKGDGWDPAAFEVKQWYYKPTKEYGGPKLGLQQLPVKSATVSDDGKKVFLEIDGLKEGHVAYIRIADRFISARGGSLWTTECWYTLNKIPVGYNGEVKQVPFVIADNTLTPYEKEEGWELLFDGEKIDKFRNFKKETLGKSWIVDDGTIHLNSIKKDDGGWQAADGGDIITIETYEDFDFKVDWKISNCGNSGIMFNVVEEEKYDYVWLTGPEMQVLDNTCHPDTKFRTHRAGDLYDMIETKYVTVKPAGQWNEARIVSKKGKVDFYLNGSKVVNFEMHTPEWTEMIANSKFKDMPDFGLAKSGHISLQDHGDKVWFKNIKIRKL